MDHVACRNCGNENVHYSTKDNKVVHYDCLDCNYEWSAPRFRYGHVLFNMAAILVGVVLIVIFGLSSIVSAIWTSLESEPPFVLLFIGMGLVITFAYRSLRTYRFIRK